MTDPGSAADGPVVRVLTYNVRSLRDDPAATAAVLRGAKPDVVLVQETPRFLRWRSKLAELAREAELVTVTGGRTAGAVAILAGLRARVVFCSDVLLPKMPGLHQRGVALAVLEFAGVRVGFGSTHLSLDPDERGAQAPQVLALMANLGADLRVLGGDINEGPDGPAWGTLAAAMADAHATAPWGTAATFPAPAPDRRIDGIFVSSGVCVVRCGVPPDLPFPPAGPAVASDHLPVVADLVLPRPKPAL
jgi:endonuclease/exonuclease/phosphatase family metal-dependent hydrolase